MQIYTLHWLHNKYCSIHFNSFCFFFYILVNDNYSRINFNYHKLETDYSDHWITTSDINSYIFLIILVNNQIYLNVYTLFLSSFGIMFSIFIHKCNFHNPKKNKTKSKEWIKVSDIPSLKYEHTFEFCLQTAQETNNSCNSKLFSLRALFH